jgi:hypothetical protein
VPPDTFHVMDSQLIVADAESVPFERPCCHQRVKGENGVAGATVARTGGGRFAAARSISAGRPQSDEHRTSCARAGKRGADCSSRRRRPAIGDGAMGSHDSLPPCSPTSQNVSALRTWTLLMRSHGSQQQSVHLQSGRWRKRRRIAFTSWSRFIAVAQRVRDRPRIQPRLTQPPAAHGRPPTLPTTASCRTLGGVGDPLDTLVLLDDPRSGCVVESRLICVP